MTFSMIRKYACRYRSGESARRLNAGIVTVVVDETRHGGGVGEGVVTALVENGFTGSIQRVASQDSFVPLGTAAQHVLLGEDEIEKAAFTLAEIGE